jgi:hypothetical protein
MKNNNLTPTGRTDAIGLYNFKPVSVPPMNIELTALKLNEKNEECFGNVTNVNPKGFKNLRGFGKGNNETNKYNNMKQTYKTIDNEE